MKIIGMMLVLISSFQTVTSQEQPSLWQQIRTAFSGGRQESPADVFFRQHLKNKQFNTIYDLIKTNAYKEQREAFLRGNADEHPMDSYVKKMLKHGITVDVLVRRILKAQENLALEKTKAILRVNTNKNVQLLIQKEILEIKNKQRSLEAKIIYDHPIEEMMSPAIKGYIEKLFKEHEMRGTLRVSLFEGEPDDAGTFENYLKGRKFLKIGENVFKESIEAQEVILEHEISGHLKNNDTAYVTVAAGALNVMPDEVETVPLLHFLEYRADQEPSAQKYEVALKIEGHNKKRSQKEPYNEKNATHPDNIKRYKAVKTIRQLHETMTRIKSGKKRSRYTQEQYEKYVIGYELAWDKYCDQMNKQENAEKTVNEFLRFQRSFE